MECIRSPFRFLGGLISGLIAFVSIQVGVAWARDAGFDLPAGSAKRPNVVLILADDLGYSDLGCYGGEIATPHLDGLARDGVKFSQFYNTGRCWPTRASLMTGFYPQQVRRDAVPGMPSGTNGKRPSWAGLLANDLKANGYRCYHSGKWHIDGDPRQQGFEHSLDIGGAGQNNYFSPAGNTLDGAPMPDRPDFYITDVVADHVLELWKLHRQTASTEPFFHLVAFTAPHFPLHAPQPDIDRCVDRYRLGWDVVRGQRFARQQAMGLPWNLSATDRQQGPPYRFPEAFAKLGANEVEFPVEWDSLNASQKAFQCQKMAIHAAMVERMDQQIGRLIDDLKRHGDWDDTLVVFLSDNGASAEMMVRGKGHDPQAPLGSALTFPCLGPGWSSVANTPFRLHKTWVHEGGISTPCIVSWPRAIPPRSDWLHQPAHVIDIVPTLLDIAKIEPPARPKAPSVPGISLWPWLATERPLQSREFWWSHEGNRALRSGDWKVVAKGKDGPWELYHLKDDRAESQDRGSDEPERLAGMVSRWNELTQQFLADAGTEPIAQHSPIDRQGADPREGNTGSLVLASMVAVVPSLASGLYALPVFGEASASQDDTLQIKLDKIRETQKLPGLIAGRIHVDGDLQIQASGVRKADEATALEVDDLMHLGSCTKAMTASLVGMAVDEGKLRWDQTLAELFPDEKKLQDSPWGKVTVDALLHHRSGAPANPPWNEMAQKYPKVRTARREVLRWLVATEPPAKPTFLYSNTGYCLLGHVLETLYDQTWESLIEKRLFEPLGMDSAGFGIPSLKKKTSSAWGHRPKGKEWIPIEGDNPLMLGPAGTVHATIGDWSKFLRWQLASPTEESGDTKMPSLTNATWEHLHTAVKGEEYAGGWVTMSRPWADGPVWFHNGSNTYWYCVTFVAPRKGFAIFAATNAAGADAMKGCDQALQLFIPR